MPLFINILVGTTKKEMIYLCQLIWTSAVHNKIVLCFSGSAKNYSQGNVSETKQAHASTDILKYIPIWKIKLLSSSSSFSCSISNNNFSVSQHAETRGKNPHPVSLVSLKFDLIKSSAVVHLFLECSSSWEVVDDCVSLNEFSLQSWIALITNSISLSTTCEG